MRMSSGVGMRMRQVQLCPICEQAECSESCDLARLKKMEEVILHIECPVCKTAEVDINREDHYQCRTCRTQYTRAQFADVAEPEELVLIIDEDKPILDGGAVNVYRLYRRGENVFPKDARLKEQQEKVEALLRSKEKEQEE